MQLAVLFTCFCLFMTTSSQEITEIGTQSVTDSTTGTQGIDWDTPGTPARTTAARDGRYPTSRVTPDYNSLFANQWRPVMNPARSLPYGTRIHNTGPREEMRDILDFYPFIQRPDVVSMNLTGSEDSYQQSLDALKQSRTPEFMPYPPGLFYPRPDMAEVLRYSVEADPIARPTSLNEEVGESQNISASSPAPFFLGPRDARLDDAQNRFLPHPMMGYLPPDYLYRQGRDRDIVIPYGAPPFFYPPPTIPRNEDGSPAYPERDAFIKPPYIDREPGPEVAESVLPLKETVPVAPEPLNPILPGVLPRQPLPLSPFPFRMFPQGLRPPFPLPPRVLPPTIPPPMPLPAIPPTPVDSFRTTALSEEPVQPSEILPDGPLIPPPAVPVLPQEGDVQNVDGISPPPVIPAEGEASIDTRIPYEFGFDMNDGRGTDQHRQEISDGSGVVTGSYGYRDPLGVYRLVNYIADKNGFRAFIKSNEPGVANPGSADVTVVAEVPPAGAIAEGLRRPRLEAVEVPDAPVDLIPEASEIK